MPKKLVFNVPDVDISGAGTAPAESTQAPPPKNAPFVIQRKAKAAAAEAAQVQEPGLDPIAAQARQRGEEANQIIGNLFESVAAIPEPHFLYAKQFPELVELQRQKKQATTEEERLEIDQRLGVLQKQMDVASSRSAALTTSFLAGGLTRSTSQALLNKTFGTAAQSIYGRTLVNAAEGSAGLAAFNAMWTDTEGERPVGIGEGAALGGAFGGGLTVGAAAAKTVGKFAVNQIASPVINATLGTIQKLPAVAQFTPRDTRAAKVAIDKLAVKGEDVIRNAGASGLADDLVATRANYNRMSGGWTADMNKALGNLSKEEVNLAGAIIERKINLARDPSGRVVELEKLIPQQRVRPVIEAAAAINRNLRFQRELLRTYDIPVKAGDGTVYFFQGIDDFIPHRHANPRVWIEGPKEIQTEAVDKVVSASMKGKNRIKLADGTDVTDPQTGRRYLEELVSRIEGEGEAAISPFMPSSQHMYSRTLDLPGYEQDLRLILPQYNDFVAKQVALAGKFGAIKEGVPRLPTRWESTKAMRKEFLFGEDRTPASIREQVSQSRRGIEAAARAEAAERGVKVPQNQPLVTPETVLREKYPRAFEQLDEIAVSEEKSAADAILRDYLGQHQVGNQLWRTANKVASLNVLDKLTFSQILQPTQMANAVGRTEWRGAFRSTLDGMGNDPEAWDFAMRSGAINQTTIRNSFEQMSTIAKGRGTISGKRLEELGFVALDTKARIASALQGRVFAEAAGRELAEVASKGNVSQVAAQKSLALREKLSGLGINPDEVVKNGGRLTQEQMELAGQAVAMDANFWSDALSLPRAFRTPAGRFFLQFKSFGAQQANFVNKHLIAPARRGDSKPLVRWLVAAGLSGEAVADIKSVIFQRERPTNPALRLAENLANSAGFGIFWDGFVTASRGGTSAYGFAFGPTVSTGAEFVERVGSPVSSGTQAAVSGDIEQAMKDYQRAGKGAGRFAIRRVLPIVNRWTAVSAPFVERAIFGNQGRDTDSEEEREVSEPTE